VLDLKRIREDPDGVSAALARRDESLAAVVGEVLQADSQWRAATTSAETLRAEQKTRSEEFGAAKARGEGLRLNVRHAEVVIGEPARGEGDWRPLCVEWGSGPEAGSGSGRDAGWARREQRWVLTVVGGGAGPPRALVAHWGAPEGSTTMAQAATKSPPFGFAPGNRPSPSV